MILQDGGGPPGAAAGSFKINVVPRGAWQSPHGVVFGSPGQVFADNRFPYLDHLKTVLQLQKQAFLQEMCVEEKFPKQPYAWGMDEDTYFRMVEIPCMIMAGLVLLVFCTMILRCIQGKPMVPFGEPCDDGQAGVRDDGGDRRSAPPTPGGAAADYDGYEPIFSDGASARSGPAGYGGDQHARGHTPVSAGPTASGPGVAPDAASGAKKDDKELPYERIPTPGAAPYLWSPPPTIFMPSPTPAGTPFVGSPGGAGGGATAHAAADDDDDEYSSSRQRWEMSLLAMGHVTAGGRSPSRQQRQQPHQLYKSQEDPQQQRRTQPPWF